MQIDGSRIHENNIKKETGAAGTWIKDYNQKLDREMLARIVGRPQSAPARTVLRLPTSSVAARMQGGWSTPQGGWSIPPSKFDGALRTRQDEFELARAVTGVMRHYHPAFSRRQHLPSEGGSTTPAPPGFAHPLAIPNYANYPRQRMPSYYGRTLHVNSTAGTDPRAR